MTILSCFVSINMMHTVTYYTSNFISPCPWPYRVTGCEWYEIASLLRAFRGTITYSLVQERKSNQDFFSFFNQFGKVNCICCPFLSAQCRLPVQKSADKPLLCFSANHRFWSLQIMLAEPCSHLHGRVHFPTASNGRPQTAVWPEESLVCGETRTSLQTKPLPPWVTLMKHMPGFSHHLAHHGIMPIGLVHLNCLDISYPAASLLPKYPYKNNINIHMGKENVRHFYMWK